MPEFLAASHTDLVADGVVLCANHRLARHLRQAHDRERAAAGLARWQPLQALTLAPWLSGLVAEALLAGQVAVGAAPRRVLTPPEERLLWERVIAADPATDTALFDLEGLAASAQEANGLMEAWAVRAGDGGGDGAGEETRHFLRWRAAFRRRCAEAGWLEPARALAWQIDCIAAGAGRLPGRLMFAGYDRYTPQELRLAEVLSSRGVALLALADDGAAAGDARVSAQADRRAECRAAAAWAAGRLAAAPSARLAIVVPELAALRDTLADALDTALQPAAYAPAAAEMPRRHNFSLGAALASQPLVATALGLLRLAASPRKLDQAEAGALLRRPYWSADRTEADGRARLEARLRERLAPTLSLERLVRFVRREGERGAPTPALAAHLQGLQQLAAGQPARQWPSAWGAVFRRLLAAAGWPGERSLSSHEYQARQAFVEALESLARLDAVLGPVAVGEAVARLSGLCRERVFQAETEGDPAVQVMGPLEAAGARFDGLWVMGMNDHVWPPAPRPNPLLPAAAQRRARAPASCAEVESAFARAIHGRLLASAPEVIFSWARSEGDRALRPSPLIAGLPAADAWLPGPGLAVGLMAGPMESIEDHRAPPLAPGEAPGGGARLLQAQALCPAWAFHRYRLGAKVLESPVEGLDARARGNVLHRLLELFWRERGLDDLLALQAADGLAAELGRVAELALGEENAGRDEPMPPRFLALERARLVALVGEWLALEAGRTPFAVVARERDEVAELAGLAIKLRVDRVDQLPDGRRLILDYKSGGTASPRAWDQERIGEPQLPLYAAFAPAGEEIAGIAFAKVVAGKPAFAGQAAADGLLPGVRGREDWPAQVGLWRQRLAALAAEVREGWAPVSFEREADLRYCEVAPLLRLPEALAGRDTDGEEGEP
jgi:exodeoxyribonuclease-5